jgi:hypothetical protein
MKQQGLIKALIVATSLAGLGIGVASAQDKLKTQDQLKTQDMTQSKDMDKDWDQLRDQDRLYIYGSELMTEQERSTLRDRMRATKTLQERDRIRAEHRLQMDARAKERGVMIIHRDGGASGSNGNGSSSSSGAGAGGKK